MGVVPNIPKQEKTFWRWTVLLRNKCTYYPGKTLQHFSSLTGSAELELRQIKLGFPEWLNWQKHIFCVMWTWNFIYLFRKNARGEKSQFSGTVYNQYYTKVLSQICFIIFFLFERGHSPVRIIQYLQGTCCRQPWCDHMRHLVQPQPRSYQVRTIIINGPILTVFAP